MLSVGSTFEDRYEILDQLGEGSFGRVYKGRQLSTGRVVAIKVLRFWEGDTPANVENQIGRFRREMRLCAELSHPSIVRLLDSGEASSGLIYAVFEYAPGSTLRAVLDTEGRLGWAVTRHLMTQVLDALACAHARGVVHRDLKPENIMVSRTGVQQNALVLDFGLGGFAGEGQNWSLPRLTTTRELLGTPAYAAPEQLRGEPVSTRSDLYSWGLILLECLTGEPAVRGKSVHEVIVNHLSPDPIPIPPSIRSGHLRRLLQRITTKRVEQRDVTIEALLQTLAVIDAEELEGANGSGATRMASGAIPATSEGERRQLTVLFCDLVGSTELSARLDPEELREVVQAYYRSAEEVIGRFGGSVAKYLGDGILAYFGWPNAHEDDAERAVRAGLALPGAIGELNERLRPGVRLAVRVGMHTGTVIVGEDVFGETPNVAARVQQAAAPDTVVVTAETHKLVTGLFRVEECGPQTLRGVAEPIPLYRVVQPSGVRSRFQARAARGLTPFVGREEERSLLRQRFERARDGEGQVVLLVGEPGIGKSRLAQVLREDLTGTPHTWLESGGAPYFANTPFYAVTELLKQFLSWEREGDPEARVAALGRALESAGLRVPDALPLVAPLLELPVPKEYPPVTATPEVARKRLLSTLVGWVFGSTRHQPVIILLEDLQWVDPSTLELQQLLIEQGATVPLLLLYSARPEFVAPWPPKSHHTQLTLDRLPRSHARRLVAGVAAEAGLASQVIDAVLARTDGVPLFVEELTKTVLEGGMVGSGIPATLADSLMARLDRLGPHAKEVAQVAAVFGREVAYELLHAVHPVREAELDAALARLVEAELFYVRGLPPESTYFFKHALIQDAAYGSLLRSRRRSLHGHVAAVLVKRLADLAETQPELLAHHYTEAGDAQAIGCWLRASQRAIGRSENLEAIAHLESALELIAALPAGVERNQQELAARCLQAVPLIAVRGYGAEEVERTFGRARELCQALGETPQLFPVLFGLFNYYLNRSDPELTPTLGRQLLHFAEATQDPVFLVGAHAAMSATAYWSGDFRAVSQHWEQCLAHYDPGQQDAHALVFGQNPAPFAQLYGGLTDWFLGYPDRAVLRVRKAMAMAEETRHPFTIVAVQHLGGDLSYRRREFAEDAEFAERAIALSLEHHFPLWLGGATSSRGWALVVRGELDAGIATLREGIEMVTATGSNINGSYMRSKLAEAYLHAGRVAEGLATVDAALTLAARSLDRYWEAELWRQKGELQLLGSDASGAETCFRQALEVARRQGTPMLELRAATSLARLWRAQSRVDDAHRLLDDVYRRFTEGFDTPDLRDAGALLTALR